MFLFDGFPFNDFVLYLCSNNAVISALLHNFSLIKHYVMMCVEISHLISFRCFLIDSKITNFFNKFKNNWFFSIGQRITFVTRHNNCLCTCLSIRVARVSFHTLTTMWMSLYMCKKIGNFARISQKCHKHSFYSRFILLTRSVWL